MHSTVPEDSQRSERRCQWSPARVRRALWLRRHADPYPDPCRASVPPTPARPRPARRDHLGQSPGFSSPCPSFCRHCWPADNVAWSPSTAWHATRWQETSWRSRRQTSPAPQDPSALRPPCTPQTPAGSWLPVDASPQAPPLVPRVARVARVAQPAQPADSELPVCRCSARNSSRTFPALRLQSLFASCFLLDFPHLDFQSAVEFLDRAFYRSNPRDRPGSTES